MPKNPSWPAACLFLVILLTGPVWLWWTGEAWAARSGPSPVTPGAAALVAGRTGPSILPPDPSPANSTVPALISLVGSDGSQRDPAGEFTVIVRSLLNEPMPGVVVTVDLSACVDLALSADQDPSTTWDCDARTIAQTTDNAGVATFRIAGHVGDRTLGDTGRHGRIYATTASGDFDLATGLTVAAMDEDGVNGVDAHDLFLFFLDFAGLYRARSDFDGSGALDANDFRLLLDRIVAGTSSVTPPRCDLQPVARAVVAAPSSEFALSWNDCPADAGGTGTPDLVFACNTNTGARTLHVMVTPDSDVPDITGFDALLEVRSAPGTTLPDWWDFQAGGCRLASSFTLTGLSGNCDQGFNGGIAGGVRVVTPASGGNREVIRVIGASANPSVGLLQAGMPMDLFQLTINNQRTTGTGSCAGCDVPVDITLLSVRLERGGECGQPTCETTDMDLTPQGNPVAVWQREVFYLIKATPELVANQGSRRIRVEGHAIAPGSTVRMLGPGGAVVVGTNVSVDADGHGIEADFDLTGVATDLWDVEVTAPTSEVRTLPDGVYVQLPFMGALVPLANPSWRYRFGASVDMTAGARAGGNIPWSGFAFGALTFRADVSSVDLGYAGQSLGSVAITPNTPTPLGVFSLPNLDGGATALPVQIHFTAPATNTCGEVQWQLFQVPAPGPSLDAARVVLQMVHDQGVAQGHSWVAAPQAFTDALETGMKARLEASVSALTADPAANLALSDHAELVGASLEQALDDLAPAFAQEVQDYRTVWDVLHGVGWTAFRSNLLARYLALASPPAPDTRFPSTPAGHSFCFVAALDPNDKTGPGGVGTDHVIAAGTPLDYRIRFENQPSATAAAQDVTVIDQLDLSVLDPTTFEFTDVRFGSTVVPVPAGTADFTSDVDLRPGLDLIARTTGTLDPGSGRVRVTIRSLDPLTLLPTADPLAGFLPPDVSSPEGEGSVSFRIAHRAAAGDAATIANQARIVFDANPPIDTPPWSNRIDAQPPTSQVTSLLPAQSTETFVVEWAGSDAGAGILDYSVFVSTDGGPYVMWQRNTPSTSADFAGQDGHTYAFYSVARDRVDLVEAAPPVPDATTAVTLDVDPGSIPLALAIRPAGPNPMRGVVRVEFALPREGPGSLELFDVTGRCVERLPLAGLAPGWHRADLSDHDARPGIYFIRLRQGGEERQRRVVLAK